MPLYEYQCQSCAHRFERLQKFSDPPAAECPNCGGPVEKLISSPAIQFKGSGFYITDYAKSGSDAAGAAKPGAAAASGEGGSPKTGDSAAGSGTKADGGTSAKPAAAAASSPKAD